MREKSFKTFPLYLSFLSEETRKRNLLVASGSGKTSTTLLLLDEPL
jgi:hypothetical protein